MDGEYENLQQMSDRKKRKFETQILCFGWPGNVDRIQKKAQSTIEIDKHQSIVR